MIEAFMYSLLTLIAIAEIGVTAFLIDHFTRTGYPSSRYRSLTIFLLFNAVWTTLFGILYIAFVAAGRLKHLARLTASLGWLSITTLLWLIAASLYTDPLRGGRGRAMCWNLPALDICRETQAAQALAWTAFALCIVTMIVSIASWHEDDRSTVPTSTTVSLSILNHGLERRALNCFNTSTAQRSDRLNQELNDVQNIRDHHLMCYLYCCRWTTIRFPVLCYHKQKIYIYDETVLLALAKGADNNL